MKKSFLLFCAASMMLTTSAQNIANRQTCLQRLQQEVAASPKAAAVRSAMKQQMQQAPARVNGPSIAPEGTPVYYEMSAWMSFEIGLEYIEGMANTLYFAEDGKTVYLGSLFPANFYTNDLWSRGTIDGNALTIDSKSPVFTVDLGDGETDNLYVGEVYFYEYYGDMYYGAKDIVMVKDGDHYYIDDDQLNPQRTFLLYMQDNYGDIEPIDMMYCYDLKPYTGNTTKVEVPATGTSADYIYYSLDTYGDKTAIKGTVVTDGDDYYFNYLIPGISPVWAKGTREGDKVTLKKGQFLTADMGYYLYFSGFAPTSYDNASGQYKGEACDVTFTIGADGTFSLDNPSSRFITALQNDGTQYDCVYEHRIVPYAGDVPLVPSKPYDVMLSPDYTGGEGLTLDFNQTNLTEDGEYLNPECLGYYIYFDDEVVTFKKEQYGAISADEMTLMPFGYTDAYGYDFYSAGGWNEIYLYDTTFEKVGVQAVYTVGDETCVSNIIYVDQNGEVTEEIPAGIAAAPVAPSAPATWYDLSGRRTNSAAQHGIGIRGGKTVMMK